MARSVRPPRGSELLLRVLVPPALRDEIAGDLQERHAAKVRADGRPRAALWYWGQLLRMRPWALRAALRAAAVEGRAVGSAGDAAGTPGVASGWGGDLRQAVRGLRTRPGFAVTVIVTVTLAVGATTSVFSVVNGVLLRPLDVPEPERLVRAWQTQPSWADHPNAQLRAFADRFPLSVPTFNDWKAARTGLESLGIFTGLNWVYQSAEGAEVLRGLVMTSGVFEALGVEPALGRHLMPSDDEVGAPTVVVLSHGLWVDRFGADPEVVGRALSLDGVPYTVVGVMPAGFTVPGSGGAVWASQTDEEKLDGRDSQSYGVLGRLRPGATVQSVLVELEAIQRRLTEAYEDQGDRLANVIGLLDSMVGDVRSTLLFLLAAVGLVLLIACLNIANMLSVSGLARRRELAVKAALGASRGQLVRGLLTESALLAVLGGVGGIALTLSTLPVLAGILPSTLPRADTIVVDARVLFFGLFVTGVTALVTGVLPALHAAGAHPKQMMDATGRGLAGGVGGDRIRSGLVVTEVALAFVLLLGASLLATSYLRLWNVDRGFATEGLITMSAVPNPVDFESREDQVRFRRELRERLERIPGASVSHTNQVPLSGSTSSTTYYVDRPDGTQEEATVMISVVGDDFFDVMEIGLLSGRTLDPTDIEGGPLVAVANRALGERYWPGESALGKHLRADEDDPPTTIVGVVANVRHQGLQTVAEPKLYVSTRQNHRASNYWLIRAQGDPASVIDLAREAVRQVSPSTPVRAIELLDERIAESVAVPRFRTLLVVGLALMAIVLALLGVYGVVAFAVSQRTRELAVRMAIGAHARDVIAGTLSRGARLSLWGVGLGALIAWQTTRLLEEFLFEVTATSPLTYLLVALTLGLVSVGASYIPARRASRVDPVSVLNVE